MSTTKQRGRVPGAARVEPWVPPEYDIADAAALQAFYFGRATEEQQRRAATFIMQKLCGIGELSFRPPAVDPRGLAMSFAEGKRFVGMQILKFAQLNLAVLRAKAGETGKAPTEQPT